MSQHLVHVRELAGWGLDPYEYRAAGIDPAKAAQACKLAASRPTYVPASATVDDEAHGLVNLLAAHALRSDLLAEMDGLDWSLGVVDLRLLLAFQRRLSLTDLLPSITMKQEDTDSLIKLNFGPPRPVSYMRESVVGLTHSFVTRDPNLHLRHSESPTASFQLHGGSPFFEVAAYRDRWFLRDGYHRAYALLRASIFMVPAVIVFARTIAELGATQPWFFSEEILFSASPPRVTDFLDDALTLHYDRPALTKTVRVTIEETFAPVVQGEAL